MRPVESHAFEFVTIVCNLWLAPRIYEVLNTNQDAEQMILSQVTQDALRAGAASASIVGQVFYFLDLPLGQPIYVIHLRVINENVALKAARLPYSNIQGARNARIASNPAAPTRRSRACFVVSALKLSGSQVLYQITNLLMWTSRNIFSSLMYLELVFCASPYSVVLYL